MTSCGDTSLGELKQHLNHLTQCRGIADPEYWLRDLVGEAGLRRLYDADFITSDEFEQLVAQLYSLPGVLA